MLTHSHSWTKLLSTIAEAVKRNSMLEVCDLRHPSCYKQWRAMVIALMSCAVCFQPSHNEICSRRNRPERLGRTLRHMAETAVISTAGGWMLQIGKRRSHPELGSRASIRRRSKLQNVPVSARDLSKPSQTSAKRNSLRACSDTCGPQLLLGKAGNFKRSTNACKGCCKWKQITYCINYF